MRINSGGLREMKKQIVIIGAILILFAIIFSGCNKQKRPVISSFEVIPNVIQLGNTAKLRWVVSNATSVTIDNGIGAVNLSGIRKITPTETTIFTLTAKSSTSTVTATISVIVNQSIEKGNITMTQFEFYLEITETKNARINQSQIYVIAINKNSTENQTSVLKPTITEGDGNPAILGIGDIITFHNLSDFRFGERWDIHMLYKGDIIGQSVFINPQGPYDTPEVRMTQSESFVTIIGIINGPLNQAFCSITAINATSKTNQTSMIGATLTDRDNNPTVLGILDQITFNNLGKFKAGDKWTIQLMYKGDIIGQCKFTNPGDIILIPT
jgi:hypothetical protein